jgi:seryl-tRNA synthetase
MIDIKLLSQNPQAVQDALASRNPGLIKEVNKITELQAAYKIVLTQAEQLRAKRNELSKQIGALFAKDPAAAQKAKEEANKIKEEMSVKEAEETALKKQIDEVWAAIPNLPDKSVPVGPDASANIIVKQNTLPLPQFDFEIQAVNFLNAWDIRRACNPIC